ncbi:MAG: hypothetical protein WCV50_02785 [Patescibacteria group bacterium]
MSVGVLSHWAENYGLRLSMAGNVFKSVDRLAANRGKDYYKARQVMDSRDDGPFLEGKYKNRKVWIYEIVGEAVPGSGVGTSRTYVNQKENYLLGIPFSSQKTHDLKRVFYGWCFEFSTHTIPFHLLVSRRFLEGEDKMDTESGQFERDYDINKDAGIQGLQLLDPVMMELIYNSKIASVEFSDSSVVLCYTQPQMDYEVMDNIMEYGVKMAEQVDRNFPLDK